MNRRLNIEALLAAPKIGVETTSFIDLICMLCNNTNDLIPIACEARDPGRTRGPSFLF